MPYKILSGPRMNALARGQSYGATPTAPLLVSNGGEDANYPVANLHDGRPSIPFRFTDPTAMWYGFIFINQLVQNGDFEQSGIPGWTSYQGVTLTQIAAESYKGTNHLQIATTSQTGGARQTIQSYPGEWLQLRYSIKGDGVESARIILRNNSTARILNSSGAWVETPGTLTDSQIPATWKTNTLTFQVEGFNAEANYFALEPRTTDLTLFLAAEHPSTCHFDEVLVVPAIRAVSVHGHGFHPNTGFYLRESGADYWHSSSWTIVPNWGSRGSNMMTGQCPTIEDAGNRIYYPQYQILFSPFRDTTTQNVAGDLGAPWIGELVAGDAHDLPRNPDYPVTTEFFEPNVRYQTSAGGQWVMPRSGHPRRRVTMPLTYHTDAEYREVRERIYHMSRGGAYPVVLIPTETDPDAGAIFGRVREGVTFVRTGVSPRRSEFIVEEEPLPWIV